MLEKHLTGLRDPRRAQGQRYKLKDLLLVSILAILSGAESYRDIARFMKLRLNTLNHWLGISWKGSPSKSLLGYVMGKLAPESVENIFREYSAELAKTNKLLKNSYAIDGNALRGSFNHLKDHKILQILSVFCTGSDLILAHRDIADKTNEIPEAQTLIKELGLPPGSVYTLDAMHCQKKHLKPSKPQKES